MTNDPGIRPSPGQVDSPPQWIHPDAGKMPKLNQWSVSLQREITRDLVVDVAYVGNRGKGFTANNLLNLNGITEERLRSFGLDINNANDQALLRARLDSPLAASRGFNRIPYASYSTANTVAQSLRPFPQFGTISALGVPLGESRYDSLQLKANKRYSHGLNLTATFTWQNERTNILPGNNQFFNDPVDRFYVSDLSEPLISVVAFSYQVPAVTNNRVVRAVVGGWTFGGMVRYATGMPIPVPASQNQLNALLFQNTRMNRVEGEPLYVVNRGQGDPLAIDDLNSGDIEPSSDFVLNPGAWANPAAGQFGTSLPYYDDFRYQRRPDEQLSIGRSFRPEEPRETRDSRRVFQRLQPHSVE